MITKSMLPIILGIVVFCSSSSPVIANSTESWLAKRAALIDDIFGYGPGVLPNKTEPDSILTYLPTDPGLKGLVWNLTNPNLFEITSTVFYSPVKAGKASKEAVFYHHGHENCACPASKDDVLSGFLCRPGCNSTNPTHEQVGLPGSTNDGNLA